jgi:hypothetical protein
MSSQGKDTLPYPRHCKTNTFAREEHDIREIKHIIVTSGARQIPKCRR